VSKIATDEKTNIEEIVSDTEPMESKNDDYDDDSDHHYKSRNEKASDAILKFI
jgi:hypothetical protein